VVDQRDTARLARAAYVSGWANSGGPLTERVVAGCVAAMDYARAHAHDPDVLEVTHDLGSLEGMWAMLYARREQVYDGHIAAVAAAWKALASQLPVAALVADYHHRAGITEVATDPETRAHQHAAALAAALAAIRALLADTTDRHVRRLLTAIQDAVRAGHAEGQAGAIAIAAHDLGHDTIDWDTAYQDAYTALTDADDTTVTQSATVAGAIAAGAAGVVAHALVGGATGTDVRAAATGQDRGSRAVRVFVDTAVGAALAAGADWVYSTLGVGQVLWVTAGDGRVCANCQGNEDSSPYDRDAAPEVPAHPNCRCQLVPNGPIARLTQFARYLISG
jgi:hypothetical protein